jgi:hypothetical protein
MKPHLLLVLLLAIPPLLCNILACENAETPETAPAAKSFPAPKDIAIPAVTPAPRSAAPAPKALAKPTRSGSAPSRFTPWSMM